METGNRGTIENVQHIQETVIEDPDYVPQTDMTVVFPFLFVVILLGFLNSYLVAWWEKKK